MFQAKSAIDDLKEEIVELRVDNEEKTKEIEGLRYKVGALTLRK